MGLLSPVRRRGSRKSFGCKKIQVGFEAITAVSPPSGRFFQEFQFLELQNEFVGGNIRTVQMALDHAHRNQRLLE